MIELNIPGRGLIQLEYLVSDINGTIAVDGHLLEGVTRLINELQDRLEVRLLSADTHGRQSQIERKLNLKMVRIQPGGEQDQKAAYIERIGSQKVIAFGQGANDAGMLKKAVIGICIFSAEGAAVETLNSADLVVPDIETAFELIQKPIRLVASLRK
jgi:P-type E1-E2 ATPase